MTIADSNRAELRFALETAWGETPASPAATALRITSETLGHEKRSELSNEVRADRQRGALIETGQSAGGDISFELSFGGFEPFLEAALGGALASALVSGQELVFAASTVTASAAASTVWDAYQPGQALRVTGAGLAANNAVVVVEGVAANVLGFTGATGAAETTSSAAVQGRMIRNGTDETSFFLETDFTDIAAVKYFTGMMVDRFRLAMDSDSIVTGVFSFVGKRGYAASATVASTVVALPPTTLPVTGIDVVAFDEGGAPIAAHVQSLSLSLDNNRRARQAVGSKPAVGVGQGSLVVTGSMQVYFETIALYEKFLDHDASSLSFRLEDASGNAIRITLPRIHYTAGNPQAAGLDADVFLPLDFQAVRDPATGATIQLDLLPAAP